MTSLTDKNKKWIDLIKFSLASFSSFIIDYALFCALSFIFLNTATGIVIANIIARVISAVYNYSINCRCVFKTSKHIKSGLQYFLLALFILIMNSIVLELYNYLFSWNIYISKILTELTLFIVSFLVQKCIIFRRMI